MFPLQETKNWKYVAVFHIYTLLIPPLGPFYMSLAHYYSMQHVEVAHCWEVWMYKCMYAGLVYSIPSNSDVRL